MEKAGLIGLVKLRYIESDENLALRGDKLKEAIKRDRDNGLIPFYVSLCCYSNLMNISHSALRYTGHHRSLRL